MNEEKTVEDYLCEIHLDFDKAVDGLFSEISEAMDDAEVPSELRSKVFDAINKECVVGYK